MAKRPPINSTDEALRIFAGVGRELSPPGHVPLDDCDWPFWHSIVAEFAKADWTDHRLELCALLAKEMADLERNQRLLRAEGFVFVTACGAASTNPRGRVVQALSGQIMALRRSLALHARGRSGDSRNDAARRASAKAIEGWADGIGEDDLLARPS